MPKRPLSDFEARLIATIHSINWLGNNADGMTIHQQMEASFGACSLGSVYVALEQLEEEGLVISWFGDPTPERGNRPKRFFILTKQDAEKP